MMWLDELSDAVVAKEPPNSGAALVGVGVDVGEGDDPPPPPHAEMATPARMSAIDDVDVRLAMMLPLFPA